MYKLDIKSINKETFAIQNDGTKEIYNTDNLISASDWVRQELKGLKTEAGPQMTSFYACKNEGRGTFINSKSYLGQFHIAGTSVYKNTTDVGIYSINNSNGNSISILIENFHKIVTLFVARKSITPNWINCKDEYLAPNETHPLWKQFVNDSIVYSLFNNSSQQSSLRKITYKDKLWDIKNEFFWLSKQTMLDLAEQHNFDELYKDAKTADERFVYKKLFGEEDIYSKLSLDAKEVLDMATELLKKSFSMRKIMAEEKTEYHLQSWDAGYAQMKLVWKEYYKDDFKKFRDKYKEFENRMRPLVYDLGFLKK